MTKNLTEGSPGKLIFSFAMPILVGILFQQFYSMVDAIVVGQFLGTEALAGVGSTGSINFLIIGFGIGVCSGFGIPIAHRFGAGDMDGLRKNIGNGSILAIGISIVMSISTFLLCNQILMWMQTPEEIMHHAYSYISIIFLGAPVIFLYNMAACIIRAIGDSKTPVYFLLLSSVINIVLDFVFIAGIGMGVEGAAIATVISQLISGVACVVFMLRKFEILRLSKQDFALDQHVVTRLLGTGIPMGLQYSITAIGSVVLQTAVNGLGALAVAAMTAGGKLNLLLCCPTDALGVAMATYMGQNVGAKKMERLNPGIKVAHFYGFIYSLIAMSVVWVFGEKLLLLFIQPSEIGIIGDAMTLLKINSVAYPLLVIVNVVRFSIQGMGFSTFAMLAGLMEMIARTLGAVLLIPAFGFLGACFGNALAWIFADIFLIPAYFYTKKKIEMRLKRGYE